MLTEKRMYRALVERDSSFEGLFVVGVKTTGIFCRPSCRARKPKRANVVFFPSKREALLGGYQPCKICRPMEPLGEAPTKADARRLVAVTRLTTPLGPMLAGATEEGICLLEFVDRRMLPTQLTRVRRVLSAHIAPGDSPFFKKLEDELAAYFEGRRKDFTVPLVAGGTNFQRRVWKELRRIPYGATLSYQELATRLGAPNATRAVARANGDNRIAIVIPCHRVIGKNGTLVGYGGGLERKKFLLELERRNR